jgi:hypothetical protein
MRFGHHVGTCLGGFVERREKMGGINSYPVKESRYIDLREEKKRREKRQLNLERDTWERQERERRAKIWKAE